MKCCAEACGRDATHRIVWKNTALSAVLCVEHINVFIQDDIVITTDIESEWRSPPLIQLVLDEIVAQGEVMLADGRHDEAGMAVGMALAHVQNAAEAHNAATIDKTRLEALMDALHAVVGTL